MIKIIKKRFTAFLTIALGIIFCVSAAACGCGGDKNPIITDNGNHKNEATVSEHDLVKDGKSGYTIIYSADGNKQITELAVSELQNFFEQATGVFLEAKEDKNVSYNENSEYIVLGDNSVTKASGAFTEEDAKGLTQTAFVIKTVKKSVFLVGGAEYGTLNAVYEFLRKQFNFECYATDEIAIDTGVSNAKLLEFDVKEIPDFTWRASGQGELLYNTMLTRRLSMNMQSDFIMTFGGAYYHNFTLVVTEEENYDLHSEWVSPDRQQLCLTRDLTGLGDYVVEKMKKEITDNPDAYALGFTQMDDAGWCNCQSCVDCKTKYGADSASQILFMNYCWDKLEPWLKENFPDREVYLYMFAYQSNTEAPATFDAATKQWKPNAPELVLRKNIYVQYAPIYAAGYHSYGSEENKNFDDTMNAWLAITDNVMFWSYSFYYKTPHWPYYDFSDMAETYKYLKNHKVVYLFDEEYSSTGICKDWCRLKAYLKSKLAWNTDCDVSRYTDEFFVNYFKAAAPAMKRLFDEYSAHYATLIAENGLRGQGALLDINKAEFWPKGLLFGWIELFNKAYEDIAFLKTTDPALYEKLEYRICLESLNYRYMCETFYGTCAFTGSGNTLSSDAARFGFDLGNV